MKAKSELIRQGDVCLIPVAALPKGAIAVAQKDARVVLAYGEVTGHAHAIYDHLNEVGNPKVRVWDAGVERFLQVLEPVTLRHEEHTHKVIPPGIYHLPKQMEYTAAELVRVTD
jgi:hypothetical protein